MEAATGATAAASSSRGRPSADDWTAASDDLCDSPGFAVMSSSSSTPGRSRDRLTVAVTRHAHRADSQWDPDWFKSQDSVEFAADPPITKFGRACTRQLAAGLTRKASCSFRLIITSPYLRCVQTALELADHMGAELLLDAELGEVYGPHLFGEEPRRGCPWRSWPRLLEALEGAGYSTARLPKDSRVCGTPPVWPESLSDARVRYANCFLAYLRRARRANQNFVLVTHGYGLQACMAVLPQTSNLEVSTSKFCACVLAKLHSDVPAPLVRRDRSASPTRLDRSSRLDADSRALRRSFQSHDASLATRLEGRAAPEGEQGVREEQNKAVQDALLHYWEVSLAGIEYVAAAKRRPETARMLARLGPSWTEIERLLGVLPPMAKVVRDGRSSVDEGSFVSARNSNRQQEAGLAAETAPPLAGAVVPCQAEEKDVGVFEEVPVLLSWLAPADPVRGLVDAAAGLPPEALPLPSANSEALIPGISAEMDISRSPLAKRRAKQVAARSFKFSQLPPPMSQSSADEEAPAGSPAAGDDGGPHDGGAGADR